MSGSKRLWLWIGLVVGFSASACLANLEDLGPKGAHLGRDLAGGIEHDGGDMAERSERSLRRLLEHILGDLSSTQRHRISPLGLCGDLGGLGPVVTIMRCLSLIHISEPTRPY